MTEPAPETGTPDTLVVPYAEGLLACLCTELAASLGGPVCQCCLRPGGVLVPMDACGCSCDGGTSGQASVQVVSVYPSPKFPRQGVDDWSGPCGNLVTWVAELAMTVYRCVHGMDENGTPPTCAQLEQDFRVIQADAAAMRRAFACCDWNTLDRRGTARVIPQAWQPVAPQGQCAGGVMTVLVDLGPVCCQTSS